MSTEYVKARTADRKAKGLAGVYPEHAGKDPKRHGGPVQLAPAPALAHTKPQSAELRRSLALAREKCPDLGAKIPHQPCASPLHRCNRFGDMTSKTGHCMDEDRACCDCEHHPVNQRAAADPLAEHFNPSLVEWRGHTLLATRKGWTRSRIYLTELGADLKPTGAPVELKLAHPLAKVGQEDPRLMVFGDRLQLWFVGVELHKGQTRTHQLVADLDEDLQPVNVWAPQYAHRQYPREKNWSPFVAPDGNLCSVYSISPHVVLCHRGTIAEEVARVPWFPVLGGYGHLRGGAPPVRVGDEYYHFFHTMTWDAELKHKKYALGVYTFDATFPFAPKRGPVILKTPPADRPGWYASVVFPCGALLRGDEWLVSYGVHDHRYEIGRWSRAEVDAALAGATDGLPPELLPAVRQATEEPGWCGEAKARALTDLVLREQLTTCAEIGVFAGQSLIPVAAALQHQGAGVVHAIDPWTIADNLEGEHPAAEAQWWPTVDIEAVRQKCLAAIESFGVSDRVIVHRAPAQSVVDQFADGSLDLLHIDGNHSTVASTRDVRTWLPKVRAGGWVAFDDSHWPEVRGALDLLDGSCELIRDYSTWRLYRKR